MSTPLTTPLTTFMISRNPADLPDDLLLNETDEVRLRQDLMQVALGRRPACRLLRVGRLFDVHSRSWLHDAEIAFRGRRIAHVGPRGSFAGTARTVTEHPDLAAVPGFGEVHKHIESTQLTPDHEAALVLPRGNTWTCEASHELSNVIGPRNLDFWLMARRAGSALKIFPQPGSAVPPTAWEGGGGYYGRDEMAGFLRNPMVPALDEVMDWPAVAEADNPSHGRLWGMIGATLMGRGVVEGHAAGLRDAARINAFAAAGMASDHEAWTADEAWDKLRAGLFLELRVHSLAEIIGGLLARGLTDWSQIALTTDDRSVSETLRLGASDHNLRTAIAAGLPFETAVQCVTLNPARHMRLTPWVGALAPGRYGDVVLLAGDPAAVAVAGVWADGRPVARDGALIAPEPRIDWPGWVTDTITLPRPLTAADFEIRAPETAAAQDAAPGRATVQAAVLRPFHWADDFLTEELAVEGGLVQRDPARAITKFAVIDRHRGTGAVGRMFWRGTGPATPGVGLAASVAHDQHNLWAVGSCDAAMALAANTVAQMQGGWALVRDGTVLARVRLEVGGLMSARPAEQVAADFAALEAAGAGIDWHFEPTYSPRWHAGMPLRLQYATLTCAPWRWVLVAPTAAVPEGLVNVATGAVHPVVW